jgi:hypothetical protein
MQRKPAGGGFDRNLTTTIDARIRESFRCRIVAGW